MHERRGIQRGGESRLLTSGQSRDRTGDTRIFSPVLYQLSYLPWRVVNGRTLSVEGGDCQASAA